MAGVRRVQGAHADAGPEPEEEHAAAWLLWDAWSIDSDGNCCPIDPSAEPTDTFEELRELRIARFYQTMSNTISEVPMQRVIESDTGSRMVHARDLASSSNAIDFL